MAVRPTAYTQGTDFSGAQAASGDSGINGADLDAELAAIANHTSDVEGAMNALLHSDSFSAEAPVNGAPVLNQDILIELNGSKVAVGNIAATVDGQLNAADAAATAAQAAQTAAETAQAAAEAAEAGVAADATSASTSATAADASATAAAGSATAAATSATTASDAATAAGSSATNAAGSESNADLARLDAQALAQQATGNVVLQDGTDTGNVSAYKSAQDAATSAGQAATSASAASSSETAAASSASAAGTSETNAAASASAASTSETNAAASEASASGYATSASSDAATATTKAAEAATSAANAATSATNAATSETNAASSATSAGNSAGAAATSASSAGTYAAQAETALEGVEARYLGSYASAPALDPNGNALIDGALYYNSTNDTLYSYNLSGTTWEAASGPKGDPGTGLDFAYPGGPVQELSGVVTFYLADGNSYSTGDLTGPTGATGAQGIQGVQGDVGPQGPQGIQGDTGATGATGPAGANGADGADGNTILYGASDPGAGDGVDGDFFINTTSNTIFGPKASGSWPSGTSLVGPTGPAGADGSDATVTTEAVRAVNALMDDELTSIASVKGLNQDVSTTSDVTFGSITLGGQIVEATYDNAAPGASHTIDPANGTVQQFTLTASISFADSLADGESVTIMIDDGAGYDVNWPTITWKNNGGSTPTLATSGYTVVTLWKVGSTLYGAFVGSD